MEILMRTAEQYFCRVTNYTECQYRFTGHQQQQHFIGTKGNAPCKSRARILFREGGPPPLSTGTHMHAHMRTHTDTSSIYIML